MAGIHYATSNRKVSSGSRAYRLADRTFSADVAFPELIAFRSSNAPSPPDKSIPERRARSSHPILIFHGPGRIGNRVSDVRCLRLSSGYQLEVAGADWPDVVIGCIGGGSNFSGLSFPFVRENITYLNRSLHPPGHMHSEAQRISMAGSVKYA